jgi:hypothetical protein
MSEVPFVRVQTPLEQALEDIRKAQINYESAVEEAKNLSVSAAEARLRADTAQQALYEARTQLWKEAVRPLTISPDYGMAVTENSAPVDEAGWSEGAPDAEKDLVQSEESYADKTELSDNERQLKDQLEN